MVHKKSTRFDPDQDLLVYDAEIRELSMWDTVKMFLFPRLTLIHCLLRAAELIFFVVMFTTLIDLIYILDKSY